jgi:hypothetical protein
VDTVPQMAQAVQRMNRISNMQDGVSDTIQYFLDRLYTNRNVWPPQQTASICFNFVKDWEFRLTFSRIRIQGKETFLKLIFKHQSRKFKALFGQKNVDYRWYRYR